MKRLDGVMIDDMSREEMLELLKKHYTKCVTNPVGYHFIKGAYYLLTQEDGRTVSAHDGENMFFMTFTPEDEVEQYFSNKS